MSEDLTQEGWLLALEEASKYSPGAVGLSTNELRDLWNVSVDMGYVILKRLKKQGKLVVAHAKRETVDGRMVSVPVYRLKSNT
jgi:hypothetical protein